MTPKVSSMYILFQEQILQSDNMTFGLGGSQDEQRLD